MNTLPDHQGCKLVVGRFVLAVLDQYCGWTKIHFAPLKKPSNDDWPINTNAQSLVHFAKGCWDFNFLPTNGFSTKPLELKLLAGEQKATEVRDMTKEPPQETKEKAKEMGDAQVLSRKPFASSCQKSGTLFCAALFPSEIVVQTHHGSQLGWSGFPRSLDFL